MPTYKKMPDQSRVWVYQSNRKLTHDEIAGIEKRAEEFLNDWTSHGQELTAAIEIFYDLFIIVFVDQDKAAASGCSIDKSLQFIKELEVGYKLSLLDRLLVAYRDKETIQLCLIDHFEKLLQHGEVTENTVVFNNLVDTKKDFDTQWEVLLKDSWHKKLLH